MNGATRTKARGRSDGPGQPIRISDVDYEVVATTLGQNAAEGRLTMQELDERLDRVYTAKTYAELRPLLADLPPSASAGNADGRSPGERRTRRVGPRRRPRSRYLMLSALCWAIWRISIADSFRQRGSSIWSRARPEF